MQKSFWTAAFRPPINPFVSTAKAKRSWVKLTALTLCTVLTASGAAVAGFMNAADKSVAVQGHAKRYMRINEYLFHGTQKGTAIAAQVQDKTSQHV